MPMTISWTPLSAARFASSARMRDRGFRAFEREALLADEAAVEEVFELFAAQQIFEDAQLLFARRRARCRCASPSAAAARFSPRAAGCTCTRADLAAIGGAQQFDHLAQRGPGGGRRRRAAACRR
jgi:hypothetical protein